MEAVSFFLFVLNFTDNRQIKKRYSGQQELKIVNMPKKNAPNFSYSLPLQPQN